MSRWCRMAPKIEELYVKKGYPVRLVQEIMMYIYQFEARYAFFLMLGNGGTKLTSTGRSQAITGIKKGLRGVRRRKVPPPPDSKPF